MKEAWINLPKATTHYLRAYQVSDITFDDFALMAEAAHKAIFSYARRAEVLFGPTICTYNLHTLVCRGYKQELERGPTSRDAEFWLEKKIQDLKQRVKYRAKTKAEVVLVNDLQDTLALDKLKCSGRDGMLKTATELLEDERSNGYSTIELRGHCDSLSKTSMLALQGTLAKFWKDYYQNDASGWSGDELQVANILKFSRCTLRRDGKELRLYSEEDKRTYGTWSHYVLVTYYYKEKIEQYVAKIKAFLQATSISTNYLEALQLAVADLFLADTVLDGRHRLHRLLLVRNLQRPDYSTYPVKVTDIREALIACAHPSMEEGYFIVNDPDEEY